MSGLELAGAGSARLKAPTLRDKLVAKLARLLPLAYFKKLPGVIIVDATNVCNLRCPVCPTTFAMTRKRGMMKLEVFKRIVDDFRGRKERPSIYFNFSGEPTLNPELPEFIRYAAEAGHETFLSTNATRLDAPMCEALIKSGLARVNLCMDGFSKKAQETYRVRSEFEQVKGNIERFLSIRRNLGQAKPFAVLQTLLTSYSENQIQAMTEWAAGAGFDQIRYKTFSLGSYTSEEEKRRYSHFLPTRPDLLRHPTDDERLTCMAPRGQSVVFWNGDLGLCCIDYDRMVELPNIGEKGFIAAWMSRPALKARKRGFLKQYEICKGCSYSNADNLGFKINLKAKGKALENATA